MTFVVPQRQPTPPARIQTGTIAAPIGGLNTIDAGISMPPTDAVVLNNLVAAEYGLRTRLGYLEWVTGLGYPTRTVWAKNTVYGASAIVINNINVYQTTAGGTSSASGLGPVGTTVGGTEVDGTVTWIRLAKVEARSVIPFTGSSKDGTKNKLFAATPDGIYDCTASTQTPSRVVAFGTTTGDAGYATSTVFVNSNGNHFLLVCDEVNGYYTYTEATNAWTQVSQQSTAAWAQNTSYTINVSYVFVNGASYLCKTTGTSSASGTGPSGTGTGIVDGTCTWDYTPAIGTGDPTKFCNVTVWANRVWFTERDTANAWYTSIGSLYGTATKFPFGARFRAGGDLRGLYNWTLDGGSGVQNSLVAVSGGGDVCIYQGTDPASVASFGLRGVWSLGGGGVPYGRRIATDYGGDLLLLSTIGVIPLSRLVQGNPVFDRSQYATGKIANLFNQLAYAGRTLKGWQLRIHPQDNTLIINVPATDNSTSQLAMSLATKGWSQYPDLPTMLSMEAYAGDLYFGTTDGRVCQNSGYVDGVSLYAPTVSTPIQWEVITSFQNAGSQAYKRIQSIRPQFISLGGSPAFSVNARFDYDFSDLPNVATTPVTGSKLWDSAVWDAGVWAGTYSPSNGVRGATGCGVAIAIAVRGTANSRTSLVGIDIAYDSGGYL